MKQYSNIRRAAQRGFTLVELLVVVVILGILIAAFGNQIKDAFLPSKSTALIRSADQINNVWNVGAKACGVSTVIASSVIPAATKTVSDVIFGGVANVAAAYQTCWTNSQAKAMTEVGAATSTAGVYQVLDYVVSFSGGGTNPLQVSYAAVPDEIVLAMASKYNKSLTALVAAGDTTSAVIQYGAPTAGARTVTVIKQ